MATKELIRRSIEDETSSRGTVKQIGQSGTRLSPTCAVYSKGRILYDISAQLVNRKVEKSSGQSALGLIVIGVCWRPSRHEICMPHACSEVKFAMQIGRR